MNKILKQLPQFIQDLIQRLFNYNDINLKFFKQQYDPEVKEQEAKRVKYRNTFSFFNNKEINKSIKHINDEMDESAEEFYNSKNDDNLSL